MNAWRDPDIEARRSGGKPARPNDDSAGGEESTSDDRSRDA
jgi:hypothetical protein